MMKTGPRLIAVLAGVLLLVSCSARGVRIAEIKDHPGRYADDTVRVTGIVTSSWGVSLLPYQFYNVDDGSGEITVLARSGKLPPSKGARVRVDGRVNQLGAFGGRSLGLHLEERDRDIRR